MSEPLNQLERRVYHYMIDFLAANTYQPSIREIARKFRIKSTKTVSDLLHALENKGYIERDESRSRGVRLLGFAASGATQPVPYYGAVHDGSPALVPEHRLGFVTMDRRFLPSEDVFLLKANGGSMIGRGILDGDYVLVQPTSVANDGDIVAARHGGQVTVRTFTNGEAAVHEPSNGADRSAEVGNGDGLAILGVVCGVFRPYWEKEPDPTVPIDDDWPVS